MAKLSDEIRRMEWRGADLNRDALRKGRQVHQSRPLPAPAT
ncbi:hypothetical protein BN2497_1515 [Janthinobacterium sp. CG23_2]|nr:hypothetical protein BN2497_1515 [Janthinobacterium sp. CG23_2]CUU27155.1 hypothetical protein BN3177_1515 [Janthinobacterium sp. CG23_2]